LTSLKRAAVLLPLSAGLVIGLGACGSPIPNASEIYPKTTETVRNAQSVAINGDIAEAGKTMTIDVSGARDGSNSLAKARQDEGEVTILTADDTSYLKADENFWVENAGEAAAGMFTALAGDKWITVSDASQFQEFTVGTILDSLLEDGPNEEDLKNLTEKTAEDVDGQKAYKYSGEKGAVWIAAEGEPYLLKFQGFKDAADGEAANEGIVAFTDWNNVAPHQAPAKDQTVTLPGL
jgi:hypothetical protein